MADDVQVKFGVDTGGALAAVNALKQAIAGIAEPVQSLKAAFTGADTAIRQSVAERQRTETASLAIFKANMQAMVAAREISQRQAIGFDIEYTAQLAGEEQRRLETALDADAATLADKMLLYQELADLSLRYTTQLADDQRKLAEAGRARRIGLPSRFARPSTRSAPACAPPPPGSSPAPKPHARLPHRSCVRSRAVSSA
jgi:hypothetical protein